MSLARPALFGLATTLLLSAIGTAWWVEAAENEAAHTQVELASHQAALRLQDYIRARLIVLESISLEKQSGLLPTEQSFMQRVEIPRTRLHGYKAINWIDASGEIAWMNPREGNESARGKNVLLHREAGPVLQRAFDTREPQLTPIVEFFQGGVGFATYFPVVREGAILGAVNGVFDGPAAVTECLAENMLGSYEVRVRDGEHDLFVSPTFADALERDRAQATLTILDRTWTLEAAPNLALYTRQHPGSARFILIGAAGILIALIAVALDLRNRRRSEIANARLAALVESSSDVHLIVGERGEIRYLNGAGRTLLGIQPSTFSKTFQELLHPESRIEHADWHDRIAAEDPWIGEVLLQSNTGEAIPVLLRAVRLHEKQAGETRIAIAASDLRELRKLEADLREAQKIKALGHLAAGVAHDFNNLLTALLGFAHMARADDQLTDEAASYLDEVIRAGDRGTALTRNLLLVSRRQVTNAPPISITRQIEQARRILSALVPENIQFDLTLSLDDSAAVIAPGQLEQALINLILNSVHAMPDGGSLQLSVEQRTDEGEWIVLSVQDDGCGMSAEVAKRATEPFFSTRARGRGTGLGLYSVAGIAESCGGKLVIETEEDQGTRIELWLPHSAEPQGSSEPVQPPSPKSLACTGCILVAEDDLAVLKSMRRCLESAGYEVHSAPDGETALELFEGSPDAFDLLLSDMVMPRLGGRELAFALIARRPDLPVVLCSGYVDKELTASDLSSLNAVFLRKPFEPTNLISAVSAQLEATALRKAPHS